MVYKIKGVSLILYPLPCTLYILDVDWPKWPITTDLFRPFFVDLFCHYYIPCIYMRTRTHNIHVATRTVRTQPPVLMGVETSHSRVDHCGCGYITRV